MRSLFASLLSSLLALTATAQQSEPKDFFGGHDAFTTWLAQHDGTYQSHAFFPQDGTIDQGASVHWTLTDTHIELAMAVRATGWVAMGLSENGGMDGSDVLLLETKEPEVVHDMHINGKNMAPVLDDCQNWEWVDTEILNDDGFLMVQVRRLLDTGDDQDRVVVPDGTLELPASLVIFAWGDQETHTYHGANRARGTLRWFDQSLAGEEAFTELMKVADGYFEMRGHNHEIPAVDTQYFNYCFTWNDIVAQGVPSEGDPFSVIGFRPIEDAVKYLHHFTLFGSSDPYNGRACEEFSLLSHSDLVYGWAKGEPPVPLPMDVGLTIGPGSYQSFRLEIHYDNVDLDAGVLDSSGIRFYYVNHLREKELGLLRLGDPIIKLENVTLGDELSEHVFDCPGTCTDIMFQRDNVTVLREYLHMHSIGASMKNELIRDGQVVHTGRVDYFNFDMQGNQVVQQAPYLVQKGDAFRTTCYFDNTGKDGRFGYSSQDEMCITFIMYYPKQSYLNGFLAWTCAYEMGFPQCNEEYSSRDIAELPRVFGTSDQGEEGFCADPFGEEAAAPSAAKHMGASKMMILALFAVVGLV